MTDRGKFGTLGGQPYGEEATMAIVEGARAVRYALRVREQAGAETSVLPDSGDHLVKCESNYKLESVNSLSDDTIAFAAALADRR